MRDEGRPVFLHPSSLIPHPFGQGGPMNKLKTLAVGVFAVALAATPALRGIAQEKGQGDLADKLHALDARVVPADGEEAKQLPQMLSRDVQARRAAANQRETAA